MEKIKMLLLFLVAFTANMVEDVLLLFVYGVSITSQVFVSGIIFSLCFMFFYRIVEYAIKNRWQK